MKTYASRIFVAGYLGVLLFGLTSQVFQYKHRDHIGMYFIVWDMFCSWDTFEYRRHLVAQGESGTLYDVSPPWKSLNPYLEMERHHYDSWGTYDGAVAANVLKRTDHEPILRVMMVEEVWNKKYNMPETVWNRQFDEPQVKQSYYYHRCTYDPTGTTVASSPSWVNHLVTQTVMNNPKLRRVASQSRPVMNVPVNRPVIQQASFESTED